MVDHVGARVLCCDVVDGVGSGEHGDVLEFVGRVFSDPLRYVVVLSMGDGAVRRLSGVVHQATENFITLRMQRGSGFVLARISADVISRVEVFEKTFLSPRN